MDSTQRTLTTALLATLGAACGAEAPGAAPADAPNVVLISIDSLRADHLGCYGYQSPTRPQTPTSPAIDALAAEGVRFEAAISTTSWTLPAHAALFTGLYDSTHGVYDNGLRLAEEHVTLAEAFRDHGWQTAGFFGGPYLHPTFGLAQGFEHYQSCMTQVPDGLSDEAVRNESRSPRGRSHADVTGPRTVEEVTRWLDGADERPFFLFVHMWDVHYDFIPPAEYVEMFDPDYAGALTGVDFMTNRAIHPRMEKADFEHLLALYDGEIRFTDDNLARILAELERRGRMDNTIVVVTADHGEEFLDHAGKGHQRTLYDEVVRVPLVVSWRGRLGKDGGQVVPQQVGLVDLMPTLLTLAGVRRQPAVMGRDLTPLLLGGELEERPLLLELLVDQREIRGLRTSEFKAMRAQIEAGFDLVADPREIAALPADLPRVVEHLQLLDQELERARAFAGGRGAEAIEVDPQVLEALRGLGYVGGTEER